MYGRLIVLEKRPGICPIGFGETWRRLFAKCVIMVTGPEATNVCQGDQLCSGLKAIIDRAVHIVQDIWDVKFSTEDWGLLLLDAENAFNEIKKSECWPSRARFFYSHRHWSLLVLQNGNGTASFLHIR